MPPSDNVSDTGSGFIVGVEPAQPRRAADWNGGTPAQQVSQPVQVVPDQQQRPAYRWTDEDIAAARQQEKDKLYSRIETMDQQLKAVQEERAAELAERNRLAQEAADAQRQREEQEMGVRELLDKKEAEWKAQIDQINARYDTDRALFEKERVFAQVELYRRDRIEQESHDILPEFRDLVTGNTPEEIDRSIEAMKARTASVVANFVAAQEPQIPFQPRMGATPTAPPVGPMEQVPDQQQLTPEMIRDMDIDTYKKMRPALLQAANPTRRRG